jgi:tRNA pseudouridine38-40 synthase
MSDSAFRIPHSAFPHRNIRLQLQYDGTDFHGWQIQPNLSTIQGQITLALRQITSKEVQVNGSGRTDAGAHALAQVCNFLTHSKIPLPNFLKALNSLLPASIRVIEIAEAPEMFHSRYDAKGKHYRYRILNARWCSPFDFRYVHHFPRSVDYTSMSRASELILGEHDFSSFCDSHAEAETKTRRVVSSFFVFDTKLNLIEYNVCANGFLHHMVRNLVGTFLEVGRGKLRVEDVSTILHSRNRSSAGPTAPAKGLFLVSVGY